MRAPAPGPSLGRLLESATDRLAAAGIDTARADAEWLLAGLLGTGRGTLYLTRQRAVESALARRYEAAVARRAGREPLQRILGWEEFRGLRLTLTEAVMVPRPETEVLVELALGRLPPGGRGRRLVVDVGTGSGCIACALACARPDVDVIATDVSPAALAVARDNARRLALAGRVRWIAGDLLTAVGDARADLVVSNPPYVASDVVATLSPEVRDHDPRGALDGGPDGLRQLERLVEQAGAALRSGGSLVVETAGGAQAVAVQGLMRDAGFVDVRVGRDLPGVERFVQGVACRPA